MALLKAVDPYLESSLRNEAAFLFPLSFFASFASTTVSSLSQEAANSAEPVTLLTHACHNVTLPGRLSDPFAVRRASMIVAANVAASVLAALWRPFLPPGPCCGLCTGPLALHQSQTQHCSGAPKTEIAQAGGLRTVCQNGQAFAILATKTGIAMSLRARRGPRASCIRGWAHCHYPFPWSRRCEGEDSVEKDQMSRISVQNTISEFWVSLSCLESFEQPTWCSRWLESSDNVWAVHQVAWLSANFTARLRRVVAAWSQEPSHLSAR